MMMMTRNDDGDGSIAAAAADDDDNDDDDNDDDRTLIITFFHTSRPFDSPDTHHDRVRAVSGPDGSYPQGPLPPVSNHVPAAGPRSQGAYESVRMCVCICVICMYVWGPSCLRA
jgi:hypothetical protein